MKFLTIALCCVTLLFLGTSFFGFQKIKEQRSNISYLENKIDGLDKYRIREEKINRMTKTLQVHYDHLSWYEAHYYSVIFCDFSEKYDIPWEIYPAVMRIESNFDPTLKSTKGAKGITQVIESTGKDVAEKLGITYVEAKTLWNDLLNIVIGFTYLSEHVSKQGLEKGTKIYNGGPGFKKGHKVVGEYRTTVGQEYVRLKYLYNSRLLDEEKLILSSDTLK